MEISVQQTKNYQQFNLKGLLTFDTSNDVEKYITKNLSFAYNNILLDMQEVEHLSSAALCSFYRFFRQLTEQNINIYISKTNEQITQLFSITGVDKYFSYIDKNNTL